MSTDAPRRGVLELLADGRGVLRDPARHLQARRTDPVIDSRMVHAAGLRPSSLVTARVVPGPGEQSPPKVAEILEIDGEAPEKYRSSPLFHELTAIDPHQQIRMESTPEALGGRSLDLLAPVGKGQRGLIVAPPRTGKTILLQQIAAAVTQNHPEVDLTVLLVDERPEEVTEMRRTVKGTVLASSNDNDVEEHVRIADLAIERGRRLAERGQSALILMDSLTRLARAHNKLSSTGRTLTGGVDMKALDHPKRLFGAARAFQEGGSLTILATCLIDTGSRMDEVIFQEFKGTGNLEVVLDRRLANRRVWPAIDPFLTGTRKEERLLPAETLRVVNQIRRTLAGKKPDEAMESFLEQLGKAPSNEAFLTKLAKALKSA